MSKEEQKSSAYKKYWKLGAALDDKNKYKLVLITLEIDCDRRTHTCSQCSGFTLTRYAKPVLIQWLTNNFEIGPPAWPTTAVGIDDQTRYTVGETASASQASSDLCVNATWTSDIVCYPTAEDSFVRRRNATFQAVAKCQADYDLAQKLKQKRATLISDWEAYRAEQLKTDTKSTINDTKSMITDHVLPQNEDIIVWKAGIERIESKVSLHSDVRPVLIELSVPKDMARVTQTCTLHEECRLMRKSRVQGAFVKRIVLQEANLVQDLPGSRANHTKATDSRSLLVQTDPSIEVKEAFGWYETGFKYVVNQSVAPDWYESDPSECCGHGIHVHKHRVDAFVHSRLMKPLQAVDGQIRAYSYLFPPTK